MMIQLYLIRVWITVAQCLSLLILSPTAQRITVYMVMVVFAAFGLHLLGMSDFYKLGISALHLLNKVPFGEPWP